MGVKENYYKIIKEVKDACTRSKRDPSDVEILAATKRKDVKQVQQVIDLGITAIGESTIQEALGKVQDIKNVKKHFIGHLQTNKVKAAVEHFDVIESVDTLKLAKEINKKSFEKGKIQQAYIEINIGNEENKQGIYPEHSQDFYNKLLPFTNIKVTGIMCIAPYVHAEETRPYFKRMKEIFDALPVDNLSMGMSNDYAVAVEEGATEIRIGKALFGKGK